MPDALRISAMEGMSAMGQMSQIVKFCQAPDFHNPCVARILAMSHTVNMEDDRENQAPNNLRAWRRFRGLTQAQLAEIVGTNANMIGYLENGQRDLSSKWLRRLAPALDTTAGMLLDHNPLELDADIIDIWTSATAMQRRQLVDLAKVVVPGKTGTDDR